jgi:hypothetical protein
MEKDCVFCEVQNEAIYAILIYISPTSMISGFHHEADENCTLLGYYTMSNGNFLLMFQDNLSVPSSTVKNIIKGRESLTVEEWTNRLSQNVGKKLPLLTV